MSALLSIYILRNLVIINMRLRYLIYIHSNILLVPTLNHDDSPHEELIDRIMMKASILNISLP